MSMPVKSLFHLAVVSATFGATSAEAQFFTVNEDVIGRDCGTVSYESLLTHPDNPYGHLGWIPTSLLPENAVAGECHSGLCSGFYYNPSNANVEDLPEGSIHVLSDGSSLSQDGQTEMFGNVQIRDGNRLLRADQAILNTDRTQLELIGNIRVQEPEVLFLGERAILDTVKTTADLQRVEYVVFDTGVHGFTERLQRFDNGLTSMTATSFSSCEPGQEVWNMSAEKLNFDQESGWGEASGAVIRVKDVPVVYVPYIKFPIDERRLSGLLWPTIGVSERTGLELAVPYYFNLAPHYDLTLTPRIMSKRGLMMESQFRYLTTFGQWDLAGAYLPNDDVYSNENPGIEDDRWYLSLRHEGEFADGWSSLVDFNRASDVDYFRDLQTTSIQVRRNAHLQQRAEVQYSDENWQLSGQLRGYQLMREGLLEPYRMLPRLSARRLASKPNTLNLLFMADYAVFDHQQRVDGDRFFSEVGVNFPLASAGGFLTPTVKFKQLVQNLRGPFDNGTNSVSATSFKLDGGLYFDRELDWDEKRYNQSFEPRLFYLYTPYRDQTDFANFDSAPLSFGYQQLFRENRSSSYDRIEDANQISYGFTSRLYDYDSGRELASLSFGQIYHFDRPNFGTSLQYNGENSNRSDYALNLEYHVDKEWRYSADMIYNSVTSRLNTAQLRAHYQKDETLYNMAYGLRRDIPQRINGILAPRDLEQIDVSMIRPINETWKLMARWQYDLTNSRNADQMFGVEYDSCCWKTQVLLRNYTEQLFDGSLKHDTGIFFYIELKGLGGSGGSLQNVLGENIYGYRSVEQERRLSGW